MVYGSYRRRTMPRSTRTRRSSYRRTSRPRLALRTASKKVAVARRSTLMKLSRRVHSNSMKLIGPPQQILLQQAQFFVSCPQVASFMNEDIQPGQPALYQTNIAYPHALTTPTTWNLVTQQLFPPVAGVNNGAASWADTLGFRVNTRYRIASQHFQLSVEATSSCGYLEVMVIKPTLRLRASTSTKLLWPSVLSGMINLAPCPITATQDGIQNVMDPRYWKVLMKKRIFLNTYAADASGGHGAGRGPFFHHLKWSLKQNKLVTCRNDPGSATGGPEQSRNYLDVPMKDQTYTLISCSGLSDPSNFRNVICKLTQSVYFRDQFAEPPQAGSALEFHSAT